MTHHIHTLDGKETSLDVVDPDNDAQHWHTIDGGKTSTNPYGAGHTHTYQGEETSGPKTPVSKVNLVAEISKVVEEKQMVYAWASVITKGGEVVVDSQEDTISLDELEKCAHDYIINCREAGEMHITTTGIGKIVESMVFSKSLQDALGIDLDQEGWFVVIKIDDASVWEKVKKGEYKMLSIGGKGRRE